MKPARRPVAKVKGSKAKTRSETPKVPVVKAVPTKVPSFVVAVVKALDDKKALGIRVLELGQLSSVADYMVIATGNSDPHLRALRIEVEKALTRSVRRPRQRVSVRKRLDRGRWL